MAAVRSVGGAQGRGLGLNLAATMLGWLLTLGDLPAATLSDPAVDSYNVHVGTQTFAGLYQFTTNTLLVETAQAIHDLGSDVIKFALAPDYPGYYRIALPPNVTNLLTLARDEPSCHRVLDMPFRHFVAWVYPFTHWWPFDGYAPTDRASEYAEIYGLTRYLLTNYNNSGKTFYLGHWEGDWYLLPNYNTATNPTPTAIQGMIDWLNNRQQAIDDAKHGTLFSNVNVFGYAEANRVRDAMVGPATANQRVINRVVPWVTNLDCLSWSSYDGMNLGAADLSATLDYLQSQLPTNKAGVFPGRRLWIGEYGWGGSSSSAQEPLNRAYLQRLLPWGPRFILFWEIYNNETNHNFCLIDANNVKVQSYYLHQRFINTARLLTARFKETNGRLPSDGEFAALLTPLLDQPLPPPVNLALANLTAVPFTNSAVQVSATLAQGVYGDDCARVWVFWGGQDGGTARDAWAHSRNLGLNTRFNPATFTALLTNLAPQTNCFFRFYATNASGEAWAPASAQLLIPSTFSCRMRIAFTGYNRGEPLANFPVLVNLSASLSGFSYRQFASPSGGDLRFADANGLRQLSYEVDQWDTNGTSSLWVQVPQLASTNDSIWAYWGNPAATNPPAWTTNSTVWWPNHLLVWHLKESGFPYADSARQHPALSGSAPLSTPGVVGRGCSFNGASHYLDAGLINLGNAFTLSAWVKLDPRATNIQTIWANKAGGWNSDGFALYLNSYQTCDQALILETGNGATGLDAATPTNAVSPGQWHRLAASVDLAAAAARLFVDGTDRTQAGAICSDLANYNSVNLGRFTDGNFCFTGTMDEVRLETGTRSSNWLWASWMTVASNATFATCSQVDPTSALSLAASGGGLLLTWPFGAGVCTLYMTTGLAAPVAWLPATNLPALTNGQWGAPLGPGSSGSRFYRLQYW